jgi:hypothetical protein
MVGGVAAIGYGAQRATEDADCVVRRDRSNLDRLAVALRELHARLRVGGMTDAEAQMLPVQIDGTTLDMAGMSTWMTDAGPFDVLAGLESFRRPLGALRGAGGAGKRPSRRRVRDPGSEPAGHYLGQGAGKPAQGSRGSTRVTRATGCARWCRSILNQGGRTSAYRRRNGGSLSARKFDVAITQEPASPGSTHRSCQNKTVPKVE